MNVLRAQTFLYTEIPVVSFYRLADSLDMSATNLHIGSTIY